MSPWTTVVAVAVAVGACAEACEILSTNVTDGFGEGANINGNCITITPGCSLLGSDAFRSSSVNTVTVDYKSSALSFTNNAMRDVGSVTVIRCAEPASSCVLP